MATERLACFYVPKCRSLASTRCKHALLVAAWVACTACPSSRPAPPSAPDLPPPLPAPAPSDPGARGAALLDALAARVQPAWAQFLEDCRTRLPRTHVLNRATLAATAELTVDRFGISRLVGLSSSAEPEFDRAVKDVVADVLASAPLEPPPPALLSDDGVVHVRWLFARDRRQAGAATAEVFTVDLPLPQVIEWMLGKGEVARAAARIARAPASDPARATVTEHVMIEVLREVVRDSQAADARRFAVEAIGQARVQALAADVRRLLPATTATELRVAAVTAAAALGDHSVVPTLAASLPADLASSPHLAMADVSALVTLGRAEVAAEALRRALAGAPSPTALGALGLVAVPALDAKLATWFARGDARTRAAVCTATSRPATRPVVMRGLRDPDATVRAACSDAAARLGAKAGPAVAVLRALARDRDQAVRARAVVALAAVDPSGPVRGVDDPAPEVRAAATHHASAAELRTLAADADPDVRAAAIARLGARDPAALARAVADAASQVRRAAIPAITDDTLLARLASDDTPEVASDALIALVARQGRAGSATRLLARLAANPGDREHVRIALSWLLAPP